MLERCILDQEWKRGGIFNVCSETLRVMEGMRATLTKSSLTEGPGTQDELYSRQPD